VISDRSTRPPRRRTLNESLRVVHVTGATGREGAGVTAAVEGMVAGLGTRPMVDLSLVGICRPGEAWEARAHFPARRIRVACRPPRIFSYAPGLQRLMDDLHPDIVHQHGIWQYSGIVSARLREARGVPLVVSPHGMLAPRAMAHRASRKRLAWWLYQRRVLEAADMFHVTSDRERDDVRALGLRQPVAVVPFGIDVPEVCPVRTNSGALTALFLSRIHPIKGILDLVHAWGQVRPAGWRLVIAGPDECGHTAEVAAAIKQLGLAKSVSLRGACWGADRDGLMAASDLFVLPSHSENFGLIVAEACARGLPVITTQGTPWRSIQDNGCGWWVPVGVEGLSGGLQEACRLERSELEAVGRRGWQMVARSYSWHTATDRLLGVYDWLLGRRPQPDCAFME
jgi:glycosyltransferase involved in cell wall biosynthesis